MSALNHPSLLHEPRTVTTRIFFEDLCGKLLLARGDLARRLGGRVGFELDGEGGGAWTLDFDAAEVLDGVSAPLDLRIGMNASLFEKMVAGQLDIAATYARGQITLEGERQRLSGLAALLSPLN